MTRNIDHSWDFVGENTKYYTHGIHPYPAMMIPQVARRLISEYGKNAKMAYDPFCGSGSVLLEFALAQIESWGTDINPLALLISEVKTTNIPFQELEKTHAHINGLITEYLFRENFEPPSFFNIDFWFQKQVIKELNVIREAIRDVNDINHRNFFNVCFSETVRKTSNTRGGEFKLYRISEDKLTKHSPKVFEIFKNIVKRNIAGMGALNNYVKEKPIPKPKIREIDVRDLFLIPKKSIDLVVSSPPYGDSRTTVAYGQFSRLSLQWLGFEENKIKKLDKLGLGGQPAKEKTTPTSKTLDNIISKISNKDETRAKDVISFFNDFYVASENIEKLMKDNSTICWVVGNRTVKGAQIPTHKIIADFFKEFGYSCEKTIVRSIPSKRMPKKNSPTNKPGVLSSTMNEENIIILQR